MPNCNCDYEWEQRIVAQFRERITILKEDFVAAAVTALPTERLRKLCVGSNKRLAYTHLIEHLPVAKWNTKMHVAFGRIAELYAICNILETKYQKE